MRSGNLQRTALGPARRLALSTTRPLTGLRYASTEHGHEHHDHHAEDATEYPKEGLVGLKVLCSRAHQLAIIVFATSTIVKAVVFAGVIAAFYKYAPSASDDNFITRYISRNATPSEFWEKINVKHAVLEQQQADESQTLWSAQKPQVHRFRYPQYVQSSPIPSGTNANPPFRYTLTGKLNRPFRIDSQLVLK